MKIKNIVKIVYILIILAILFAPLSNVHAAGIKCSVCNGSGKVYDPKSNKLVTCSTCGGDGMVSSQGSGTINPDDYKPNDLDALDFQKPFKFARTILSAIVTVGVVICFVSIIYLGIKYMVGSVEQKAEYKKTIIPILIGMVMLICTSTIVSIIYNMVSQLNN